MAIIIFVCTFTTIQAQNLMNVAFNTNGPIGECLFPQDSLGNITMSGVIECEYSADTIMGLAKEYLYDISKKYDAKVSKTMEGVTKVACDVELKVGERYISVGVWGEGNIGTWKKAASTVKFNLTIDIRKGKYRYTLSKFNTDRFRIPGEGKDQGPSNLIHWQRVNSLKKEMQKAKKKDITKYDYMISTEETLYKAEYQAVQDFEEGLKSFAIIKDDF